MELRAPGWQVGNRAQRSSTEIRWGLSHPAAVSVDPDSGAFLYRDDGSLDVLRGGLLIRWEEVEYLEFIDS